MSQTLHPVGLGFMEALRCSGVKAVGCLRLWDWSALGTAGVADLGKSLGKSKCQAQSSTRKRRLCPALGSKGPWLPWDLSQPLCCLCWVFREWRTPRDMASGLGPPLPVWHPACHQCPLSIRAPPAARMPLAPVLQSALGLWLVSGDVSWASSSTQSREKGSAIYSAELCPTCWCPTCCPPPSFPLIPNAGRRTQQPLWADQPQPTGLYRSTRSFLSYVPVIPHLPAPSANRIHHGNPWAAHSHLQLLRLRAHGPHTAGAAAPGLHSASPASKDMRKPGGHMRLSPKLSVRQGAAGEQSREQLLESGSPLFCCSFVVHQYTGVQAPGWHTPLLGTG